MRPLLLPLVLLTAFGSIQAAGALEIHVSPTGSDNQPGTRTAPLKTLEAARDLARSQAGRAPVTVVVGDGVYFLDRTLALTAGDSGTRAAPVVYRAEHEGGAVISGGVPLELRWTSHRDGIMKAFVPADLEIDQLFVNGERQPMARYPNEDPAKTDVPYRGAAADAISPERAARWADPAGGYIHALHAARWGGYHYLITGKDENGELVYEGGWQNNRPSGMHKSARMVENIFEELDAPGEWFHDCKTRTLYFHPPHGVDPGKAKFVGVRLATLVALRGSMEKPVRFVTFDGFVFRHAARTFMENKEPLLRSDWTIHRGGSVFLEGTEDCGLRNCFIDQPGANAVFASNYHRRLRLAGLHIFGAGASGVAFVGDPAAVRNPVFRYGDPHDLDAMDRTPGPRTEDYPMECVVEDSLVHEVGMVEKQGAGVQIAMARRITVLDCSIYDTSRAGINIGDGCWGGHLIEGCDVFNTVQETGDHGSFNSWGRDRFWLPGSANPKVVAAVAADPGVPFLDAMETTVIRHSRWRCDHGWDIDLDDGSSNYDLHSNLLLHGGLKMREGYRRHATNNIIVGNSLHPHVWYPESRDVFRHNIVMGPYRPAIMRHWDGDLDFNLFTTSHRDRLKFATRGADAHSVVGDPQFADPAKGDFTVRNEEPAAAIGFENFPMNGFGVKKPRLKAIARTPEMPVPEIDPDLTPVAPPTEENATVWLGATLGEPKGEELSSYGVAFDTGGVAIMKLRRDSPLAGPEDLREGDLIQEANGQRVASIADLRKAVFASRSGKLEVKVIRKQAARSVKLKLEKPGF